jgi:ABC-type nitrate/sulfonate/bicarbonate transport system substrate-binding protein
MKSRRIAVVIGVSVLALGMAAGVWVLSRPEVGKRPLRVGISPYQDIAMLVNEKELNLAQKYNTRLELRTLAWEDILPAVASASSDSLDVGFGSLTEFLTKYEKLNKNSTDPIVFLYPLYVYKGGGFVSFNKSITPLIRDNINSQEAIRKFLAARFGAQKQSIYEMVLFSLARRAAIDPRTLKIHDMPLNDALLAAESGSIDVAEAGLTQITEARRRSGRVVLSMDDAGFADITGFICRRSVLTAREVDVKNLIRMWFDCVAHVTSDLQANSAASLDYLRKNSATRYTLEEYKAALEQEYLPRSIQEARQQLISPDGKFPLPRISSDVADYLLAQKLVDARPPVPVAIDVK